jgi:hypothetical protein
MMNNVLLASLVAGLVAMAARAHEHTAPHNGNLVEIGEEFAHLELVIDPLAGKLIVYVLDGEAEKPVRIKTKFLELTLTEVNGEKMEERLEVKPVSSSLSGEKEGDTSEFAVTSQKLKSAKTFKGKIKEMRIKGKDLKEVTVEYEQGSKGEKHAETKK